MPTIHIDFDVFKELTVRRSSEGETESDVIRKLLKMPTVTPPGGKAALNSVTTEWVTKWAKFPEGTLFRSTYKGKLYSGKVESGELRINGKKFDSLSGAAVSITGSPVNGWRFWECKPPGAPSWMPAAVLREQGASK